MNIDLRQHEAHIGNELIMKKLEKKNISASMVTALEGCQVKWVAETFVLPDYIPPDLDNPATRGSFFHKIMETFYALPAEERTWKNLRKTTIKVSLSKEFAPLVSNSREALEWVVNTIETYATMGENPKRVNIATIEDKPGLELFVIGKLGNCKRSILGFVDRIQYLRKEDKVLVEDWKTGARVKKWTPDSKNNDGWAEQRQQLIYTMLLEKRGLEVKKARLIYPAVRDVVNVYDTPQTRETVIGQVEKTDKLLDELIGENTFAYKPSFLCAWCPLAKLCPNANIMPYQKMQDAYAKQPDANIVKNALEGEVEYETKS